MEKVIQRRSFVAVVVFVCFAFISQGYGAINSWGDVDPPDPSTWTRRTDAYIGKDSGGGISVTEGDGIYAYYAFLGYNASASGTATIDGAGSSWSCTGNWAILYVGYAGQGTLEISNGGNVSCGWGGHIGLGSGAKGEVSVDGAGSNWNCGSYLSVGYEGQGTLNIGNGGNVSCGSGHIGSTSGSSGEVSVDGAGSNWDCSNYLSVGRSGQGTLNISNGGNVSCGSGDIGSTSGSSGEVSVDGAGSSWSCSHDLHVGYRGQGTLNISNGGNVNVTGDTRVARYEGSTGQINFDNGTLTTGELWVSPADLRGTGTIYTHGIVSDIDLIFDSTYGANQTIILNSLPSQNITINLSQDSTGSLGAGYASEGTLTIKDGVSVESSAGYLGYKSGSAGYATVDGANSSWSCSKQLCVGYCGQGTLNITNDGSVSCKYGYIGYLSDSTGEVSVDGEGSNWSCSGNLYVGYSGQGTLNISNGGLVKVWRTLTIDDNGDDDSFIRMATGGMLALYGDADANNDDNITIDEFLAMVEGTDEIEYWDGTDWSNITNATAGEDYSIEYHDDGDLAGYTVLTVTAVPEPATLILFLCAGIAHYRFRR